MWTFLVRFILRNRLINIIVIFILTAFMFYQATNVQISYEFASMLPESDSTYINYQKFKETFGEDGSVLFIGIQDTGFYELEKFNDWYDLSYRLKKLDGVQEVVSVTRLYYFEKNDSLKKFDFKQVVEQKPQTQQELDSIRTMILSLPFYKDLLYNDKTGVIVMAITLDKKKLNTKKRISTVDNIRDISLKYGEKHGTKMHFSGLPYIRTYTTKKVEQELKLFIVLAMLVASIALLIFFRSFKAMLFPMIIVIISEIWVFGLISILGYKLTLLTGIIPPLMIIIGVENCIFLLNKYHHEFKNHGNKIKALSRVVQRVGNATFLTNLTTAVGFAAFIVTSNAMLVEFGIVASLSIMVIFLLSLLLIPIVYSYLPPPRPRHIKHLDNKFTLKIIEKIVYLVQNKRNIIYIITIIFTITGIYGITRLKTTGNVVGDISKNDPLYKDLVFFEKAFNGILPFEILIDTKKKNGVMRLETIKRIDRLQDTLATYPEFSRPLSIAEVVKFAKQEFYNGKPSYYSLPNNQEKNFILSYVPEIKNNDISILNSFVDTTLQMTRISVQMANIGTKEIQALQENLKPKIDKVFPPERYSVELTGTSVVFLKGSQYLVRSLLTSLILAITAIGILMALLFTSYKMIAVTISTNLLPQIFTAALMGFLVITIKPSTILIFSIALGISVDNAIHYLSRYRMALRANNWNIKESVISALKETGFSMIYSSIVLFFGFAIFTLSTFGGTKAMGFLISFTLLIAVLSNMFVLPSLILTLNRRVTTKSFKEPLLEILDEEEDIDLDELEIEEPDTRGSA